jgi:uncharacterized membrane protein YfcA
MNLFLMFLVALLLGAEAALIGAGGGFFIVPFLVFSTDMSPQFIAGTSLAIVLITTISSTIAYWTQCKVDCRLATIILLGMIPGAILGVLLNQMIDIRQFSVILGVVLTLSALFLFKGYTLKIPHFPPKPMPVNRHIVEPDGSVVEYTVGLRRTIVLSFMMGVIAKMVGLGGGVLLVPVMIMTFRVHPKYMVATSCLVTLLSSLVAFSLFAFKAQVSYNLIVPLGLGVLVGAQLGAHLSKKIHADSMTKVIAAIILVIGVWMSFKNFTGL